MGRTKIGSRVGAVSHSDPSTKTAFIFGYGTYEGDKVPDPNQNISLCGIPIRSRNPCILLDNGKRVYGCECWWGPENEIKRILGTFHHIVSIDVSEARKRRESWT